MAKHRHIPDDRAYRPLRTRQYAAPRHGIALDNPRAVIVLLAGIFLGSMILVLTVLAGVLSEQQQANRYPLPEPAPSATAIHPIPSPSVLQTGTQPRVVR